MKKIVFNRMSDVVFCVKKIVLKYASVVGEKLNLGKLVKQ
jgi:hypothetical protein